MLSKHLTWNIAVLVALCFSNGVRTDAQERGYIDATRAQIRERQREPSSGRVGSVMGGYTEGQVRQQLVQSLAVSMKILGPTVIARGQIFEYEVQIQNVTDHPVEIPWNLSRADVEPADPRASYQYQTAAIVLRTKVGDHQSVSMEGSILLFGSALVRSTTIKLQPGEWVRVKSKTRALSSNPNDPWPPSDLTSKRVEGSLTATLMFSSSVFRPPDGGGSQEDSRTTGEPISSNVSVVEFRFW
jgi:hypothetical protein